MVEDQGVGGGREGGEGERRARRDETGTTDNFAEEGSTPITGVLHSVTRQS